MRRVLALKDKMNGNAKWAVLALLLGGGGGGSALAFWPASKKEAVELNPGLVEYRLTQVEERLGSIQGQLNDLRTLFIDRLPAKKR